MHADWCSKWSPAALPVAVREAIGSTAPCPVCYARARPFHRAEGKRYWRCNACAATFLDPAGLPDPHFEASRYRLHRNRADDPGYLAHLGRLAGPMLDRLPRPCAGLDYGCGSCPALAGLFGAAGHSVRGYDPQFFPDRGALRRAYDFIACSEVAEHFHRPGLEFARLDRLLRPGGLLGVMTRMLADDRRFADWRYRRDPTHVVFYKPETFLRIAARFGWECELAAPDVALLRKPA